MVDCPNCQRKLDLDLLALPAGAVSLQCSNCGEVMECERVEGSRRSPISVTGMSLIVDGQPVPITGLDDAFEVEGNVLRNTREISFRIPRTGTFQAISVNMSDEGLRQADFSELIRHGQARIIGGLMLPSEFLSANNGREAMAQEAEQLAETFRQRLNEFVGQPMTPATRSQMANELIDRMRSLKNRQSILLSDVAITVVRRIGELIESATIDDRADEVCSIPFDGELLAKFAELPKEMSIEIEQFMVRSLTRHCAARLRCSTGDLVMEVAGSWDSADYVFTVKRRKKEPPAHMVEWCRTNGYTDWAYEDGCWRAFPPNSVMSVPVPRVAFIGSSQPVYGRSPIERLLGQQCNCIGCQSLRAGCGVGQL